MQIVSGDWYNLKATTARDFVCGYCGKDVASEKAFHTNSAPMAFIYICPRCNRPTLFFQDEQVPGELPGKAISGLPTEIAALYTEAQRCVSANSYTGCVLLCRKLLMHIGHDLGAKENAKFFEYVNFLFEKHYIPPNSKGWVDYIRDKGNEANHEIVVAGKDEALGLLGLTEMLLQIIYDMPNRVPKPPKA